MQARAHLAKEYWTAQLPANKYSNNQQQRAENEQAHSCPDNIQKPFHDHRAMKAFQARPARRWMMSANCATPFSRESLS